MDQVADNIAKAAEHTKIGARMFGGNMAAVTVAQVSSEFARLCLEASKAASPLTPSRSCGILLSKTKAAHLLAVHKMLGLALRKKTKPKREVLGKFRDS